MRHQMYTIFVLLQLLYGCGTVVGNPRKPTDPTTPTAIVYALPTVDFDIGDAASDDASLMLVDDDSAGDDRTLLKGWGKRTDKIVSQINDLSTRINKITAKERETNHDDILVFAGRGSDGSLSGKLSPVTDGGDYAYEAVLCHAGKPFTAMRWSKDGKNISLTRDFSAATDDGAETVSLRSHVTAVLGDSVSMQVSSEGEWTDDQTAGVYIAEHAEAVRDSSGMISVKTVVDRDTSRPEVFTGDSYLVARLTPHAVANVKSGRKPMRAAFVGYDERLSATVCKNGFDEDAPDLWRPGLSSPRFCVGRPGDGKRFSSTDEFYQTLADLKPIGVMVKASLVSVELPPDLSCER